MEKKRYPLLGSEKASKDDYIQLWELQQFVEQLQKVVFQESCKASRWFKES